MIGLKFYFRNGEAWTVDRRFIGDLWIKHITTSFNRIHGSELAGIRPYGRFKIEIPQEGDHAQTHDIDLGDLELGMFSRALKYEDTECIEILYKNDTPDLVYFPYKDKTDEDLDNVYQPTKVSEKTKNLYIVIDPAQTVDDVYAEELE